MSILLLGLMAGKAERTPSVLVQEFAAAFSLVRIMAPAALSSRKGLVQTETVQLVINPFMALAAKRTFRLNKHLGLIGFMGRMTSQALTILHRGMGHSSLAVLTGVVAAIAQLGIFRLKPVLFCLAMAKMAAKAVA